MDRHRSGPDVGIDREDQSVVMGAVAEALHGEHRCQRIGPLASVAFIEGKTLDSEAGALPPGVS